MAKQPYTEVPYISPDAAQASQETASIKDWEASQKGGWYFEDTMAKKILGLLVVLFVGYLLYLGYVRYKESSGADSGAIHNADGSTHTASNNDNSDDEAPAPKIRPRVSYNQPSAATPYAQQPATQTMIAPATDSISPNPTNGMAFTGTGKFQVYRQGDLTWRVDTESGRTCIVFATLEEWRKPIVYQHGCANS